LSYARIVEINGLSDALWACRAEPQYSREWRLYAVWCARQVQHLMKDERSIAALDVAERHASNQATDAELEAARDAAWAPAWTVAQGPARSAARAAAWDAARAAGYDAARTVARDAARSAAWDAARAAAYDAESDAAGFAVPDDEWVVALDAARAAQARKFLEIVEVKE
jgi:hypothetical protein